MCALMEPVITAAPRRSSPPVFSAVGHHAESALSCRRPLQQIWGSAHCVAFFACAIGAHRSRKRLRSSVQRHARRRRPTKVIGSEEELEEMRRASILPPKPTRLPDRGRGRPGAPGGMSDEEIEAIIDEMVPSPASNKQYYDMHRDDPLTEGLAHIAKPGRAERTICCRGCGIPLQTHTPSNVGYVRFAAYMEKYSNRLHRKVLCNRCIDLQNGELRPIVRETLGQELPEDGSKVGFGGHVVPASVLEYQLQTIRARRCLVVYILDVLDLNGSLVRNLRKMIGKNPVLVVATKKDLLPKRTNLELVEKWLRATLRKNRIRAVDIRLVSNWTQSGINQAVSRLLEYRRGTDVFVVGSANAGKSMFIHRLLDSLEQRFPSGKVENVERPLVSDTPGTTLGIMPLRAFRRSNTSQVFASLYDTPGIHQPRSMQNLLPIEVYEAVQPVRQFDVKTFRPANDIMSALRKSGEPLTAAVVEAELRAPVRYLWGPPNADPVVVVEVAPPISTMMHLSLVGVEDLEVRCESARSLGLDGVEELPLPQGLSLARVCYLDVPEQVSHEGDVICDVAIAGFGWFSATAIAPPGVETCRQSHTKFTIRVYGPEAVKVIIGYYPIPISGLPGRIPELPEEIDDGYDISLDDDDPDDDGAVVHEDEADLEDYYAQELEQSLQVPSRSAPSETSTLRRSPKEDFGASGDYYADAEVRQNLMRSSYETEWDDDILPDDDFEDYDPFRGSFGVGSDDAWAESTSSSIHGRQHSRNVRSGEPAHRAQSGTRHYEKERNYGAKSSDSKRSQLSDERGRGGRDVAQNRSAQRSASTSREKKPSADPRKPMRSSSESSPTIGRGAGARAGLVRRIRS
mmetsp:Transcript_102444/g.256681  ORF Transcript_102444/g.256681 Transcript_102444/m.256681 type:complete len:856 (-) Transcript_102444:93-2660(-)